VQELAAYWAESYDMRRIADLLNRYEQFTTAIDGVDIISCTSARPWRARRRAS